MPKLHLNGEEIDIQQDRSKLFESLILLIANKVFRKCENVGGSCRPGCRCDSCTGEQLRKVLVIVDDWMLIESAPKDGRRIFGFDPDDGVVEMCWNGKWVDFEHLFEEYEPTHWGPYR